MIKIAIIENSKQDMQHLLNALHRYSEEKELSFSIEQYVSGEEFFEKKTKEYDIFFLDIMLDGMSGMDIAKRVRESDSNAIIVFITTVSGFAVEGFSVNALDYVIKPVKYDTFSFALDRTIKNLERKSRVKIGIDSKKGVQILSSDEITYIEVFGHSIIYHYGNDNQTVSEWASLAKPEKLLSNHGFFRCNKCYLVNLKYIEKIHNSKITVCGKLINVSPKKIAELKEKLNIYLST